MFAEYGKGFDIFIGNENKMPKIFLIFFFRPKPQKVATSFFISQLLNRLPP